MSSSGKIFILRLLLQNLIRLPNDVLLQYQSPPPAYFILAILTDDCAKVQGAYANNTSHKSNLTPPFLCHLEIKIIAFERINIKNKMHKYRIFDEKIWLLMNKFHFSLSWNSATKPSKFKTAYHQKKHYCVFTLKVKLKLTTC